MAEDKPQEASTPDPNGSADQESPQSDPLAPTTPEANILSNSERLAVIEAQLEQPEHSTESQVMEWGGFIFGLVAIVLALLGYLNSRKSNRQNTRLEADILLDQGWDLLGGKPGTAYISQGSENKNEHDLEQARRLISQALAKDCRYGRGYRVRAEYFAAIGDQTRQEEDLFRAVDLNPLSSRNHRYLGTLFYETGRMEEAEVHFRKAIELDADGASSHCSLGVLLSETGRNDEAEVHYRKAMALDARSPAGQHSLLNLLRGNGRNEEADKMDKRAQELEEEQKK